MVVIIKIGRRVPKKWYRRLGSRMNSILNAQEHFWLLVTNSLSFAKKQCEMANNGMICSKTKEIEKEDMYWDIEWVVVKWQGTKEQEQEEYDEAMRMYTNFKSQFKDTLEDNAALKKVFKTKLLSSDEVAKAYKEGYGTAGDSNIASKLLEMGILTSIIWQQDFHLRPI